MNKSRLPITKLGIQHPNPRQLQHQYQQQKDSSAAFQVAGLLPIQRNQSGEEKMDSKQTKTGKNRKKMNTNKQLTDMALALWESAEYLNKTIMRANLNSYCRDRLSRLIQRLQKEAIELGNDLRPPNSSAFESIYSAKMIARQLGISI